MNFNPTAGEKKKYVLAKEADCEILGKCKLLEKKRLTNADKDRVKLIKTQLKRDWRTALVKAVNSLLKKYKQK